MSERVYTVYLQDSEVKVTSAQIKVFASFYCFANEIDSRISELFWLDLYIMEQKFGVSPNEVLREIKNLESGESATQTKPASQFSHKPLKGLWHKHFFSAHFVPQNLLLALAKGGLEKLVDEMLGRKKTPPTKEEVFEFSHRVVQAPLEERADNNKLTGEWIIFAKHNDKNHYLCVNTHDAGDQFIFDKISDHCQRDFPFLSTLLCKT